MSSRRVCPHWSSQLSRDQTARADQTVNYALSLVNCPFNKVSPPDRFDRMVVIANRQDSRRFSPTDVKEYGIPIYDQDAAKAARRLELTRSAFGLRCLKPLSTVAFLTCWSYGQMLVPNQQSMPEGVESGFHVVLVLARLPPLSNSTFPA